MFVLKWQGDCIQNYTTLYSTTKLIFLLHDRLSPAELLTQFIADMNNYTTAV